MLRLPFAFACLLLFSLPVAVAATPHVDDLDRLLPAGSPWAQGLESKLVAFERTAGIRVLIRLQLKSPTAEEDKVPGAYMRDLATKLGVIRAGVLVVYFADDPDWRIWIGDELASSFVGQAGTAKEFTASGAMHEAKEAFLGATFAKADAASAARPKGASAQRLAGQAEALADGLIRRLTPPSRDK